MLKKVDVLLPKTSQYSVLHHFTKKFHEAFLRQGLSSRLLDGEDRINVPSRDPPDFLTGFNGALFNHQHQLTCDVLGIPFLSCLVDPPYRFLYLVDSPNTIIACDDRYCCTLLESINFNRTFFMPHAVEPELSPDPTLERNFDVVMLATFIDYKMHKQNWKSFFPLGICKIMEEASEITFSDPKISFLHAFNVLYEALSKKYPKSKFENVSMAHVLQHLEIYIKGRDRALLAKSITDMPLHIFGSSLDQLNWKTYLKEKHPNVFYHGPVNYFQALDIMKQSKIILNPSLKNKDGAHERIFAGYACGAMVITNESLYLSEEFKEGEDIIFYRHPDLKDVQQNIHHYLSHEPERAALVEKARTKTMERHTWDSRVKDVLKKIPQLIDKIIAKR